jgi:hypothetical protein
MTLPERINRARQESGLDWTAACIAIGCTLIELNDWCTGRAVPNPLRFHDIARAFRVSAEWLKTGEGRAQ